MLAGYLSKVENVYINSLNEPVHADDVTGVHVLVERSASAREAEMVRFWKFIVALKGERDLYSRTRFDVPGMEVSDGRMPDVHIYIRNNSKMDISYAVELTEDLDEDGEVFPTLLPLTSSIQGNPGIQCLTRWISLLKLKKLKLMQL